MISFFLFFSDQLQEYCRSEYMRFWNFLVFCFRLQHTQKIYFLWLENKKKFFDIEWIDSYNWRIQKAFFLKYFERFEKLFDYKTKKNWLTFQEKGKYLISLWAFPKLLSKKTAIGTSEIYLEKAKLAIKRQHK